jgi:hypothetical protein
MIELPRRSVTRFFIPLIDVLTLLFCIFLLMPVVRPSDEADRTGGTSSGAAERMLSARERQELERLRHEARQWQDAEHLQQRRNDLESQVRELRQTKMLALEQRLVVRVLEIGDDGRLFYYDPRRQQDRRMEITRNNVADFIRQQQGEVGSKDLYFLLLYPRPAAGNPAYPLLSQREEYDRWFHNVPHGYDIPAGRAP